MVKRLVYALADRSKGAAESRGCGGLRCGKQRRQDAISQLGVEDGEALPVGCEAVRVALAPLDEAVEAQFAEVIAHLPGSVVAAEQSGDEGTEAPVGEAGDGMQRQAEGAGQGHGALVPEAQGSGSLALPYVGLLDPLEESWSYGTALAGTLHLQDTTVRLFRLVDELGEMLETAQDAEVGGRVDDRLDAQPAAILEVLLDPRVL